MWLMEVTPQRAARMRAQAGWSWGYSTLPGRVGPVPSLVLPVEWWFCTDLSSTHSLDHLTVLQKSWVSRVRGFHPQNSHLLSTPVLNPYGGLSTKPCWVQVLGHTLMEFQIPRGLEGWDHLGHFYLPRPELQSSCISYMDPLICLLTLSHSTESTSSSWHTCFFTLQYSCNPLQYSCLESPMYRGA